MEVKAKPIPRATSSLPDSLLNSDSYDDILDRAFDIVESRERNIQEIDRISAEELNRDREGCLNQPRSIDEQIQQLTLEVCPASQRDSSEPVCNPNHPMEYCPASIANGLQCEVGNPCVFNGISQQHPQLLPSYMNSQGWTVYQNGLIPAPQLNMATPIVKKEEKNRLSAFICYIYENDSNCVMPDVINLEDALKSSNIRPRVDYREEELRSLNKNKWLEDCMDNSSVIIICVSPSFNLAMKCYRSKSDDDHTHSETYFLMDMLMTKYRGGGCRNYNVLPLLIAGAKFMDLPTWLQNTIVYRWPKDREKLIQRILSLED